MLGLGSAALAVVLLPIVLPGARHFELDTTTASEHRSTLCTTCRAVQPSREHRVLVMANTSGPLSMFPVLESYLFF